MHTHYEQVKSRYQDSVVATTYDSSRFLSAKGQKRNRLMLAAIQRAFDKAAALGTPIHACLDLPCGTGRLFPWLLQRQLQFVGADISREMMQAAWPKFAAKGSGGVSGVLVQCDGEYLPFKDHSLDAVCSIRFMFHVPRKVRLRILQEMARVSRRWLIVDLRHCYNVRWCLRRLGHGLGLARPRGEVWSRASLRREAAEAGLRLVSIFSPRRGLACFSDKWVVLLEKADEKSAGVPHA
jgi:SAM-dependent methyltransferase